jgi:glycosyltransferase involved in cell wall biosynthesis
MTLVCLLPVRNGEQLLPGYFQSAASFADAVVTLDDGSTDRTRAILEAEPLVRIVLSNPSRSSHAGWDDAENRSRLLEAASELEPDWILSLDADERIDPADAEALRGFVEGDAVHGFAYGLRVHRMIGDLEHYDRATLWAYRLFAYEPGQRFSDRRLHLVPIPLSIPQNRWLKTTLRIQHLGGLTEELRRARFLKYEEVDAARAFQADYSQILEAPLQVRRWERRPPGVPVLYTDAGEGDLADLDLDAPVLSAIVIAQNDEDSIERRVRAVVDQECPEPFEVIVVTSGTDHTADIVRERFPVVSLVELPQPVLPGGARNAGLQIARGDYVSFPGSHVELPEGSLAARLRAHHLGYAMVSGATLNGTLTRSGWASYFLDNCGALPDRPSGLLRSPPAHCSYLRSLLVEIGGFPEDLRAGEDTIVNLRLWDLGYNAYRAQDVQLVHHSPCRNPWRLVTHHFVRGRALSRILLGQHRRSGGLLRYRPLRSYVRRRLRLTRTLVQRWGGELNATYRAVRFLVALGILAAAAGAWFELLRPRRRARRTLGAHAPDA